MSDSVPVPASAARPAPRIEILAIGDELLHGSGIDTNSAYISARLERFGCEVVRFTVVGDSEERLECAFREAAQRADAVIATGGLGPTEDDRSRHALAAASGAELRFDDTSWQQIEAFLGSRGRIAGSDNRRQALLPAGAQPLRNDWGTAPGVAMDLADGERQVLVCLLPGVPNEMRSMLEARVEPLLRERFAESGLRPATQRTLCVLGPTEAAVGERLAEQMKPRGELQVGVTAHCGLLSVRVVARAATLIESEHLADVEAAVLRELLGHDLLYVGDASPAEQLISRLGALDCRVSVAESCTGGLLASMLTEVPGASAVFPGGFVCYSNERKTIDLGVPSRLLDEHGAVSEQVAASMAEGVARVTGSDYAVSITGIAGPDGGAPDKPVGTVCFGLRTPSLVRVWTRRITPVSRRFVRERAAFEALGALLRALPAED